MHLTTLLLRQASCFGCVLLFLVFPCMALGASQKFHAKPEDSKTMDILMKGAKPSTPDAYLCASYPLEDDEAYIYKFEALANVSTAHHMLLYGCSNRAADSGRVIWGCPPLCQGKSTIMFAWAKNAPATVLPPGVGFRIGHRTNIKTLVIQVHYAKSFKEDEERDRSGIRIHITHQKQPYVAGVHLMISGYFSIPPHSPEYPVDVSCRYRGTYTMVPFAYRTHSHTLGTVITGYQFNGTYHQIGKGNPNWPQAFYPVQEHIEVKDGDALAARCTYNSSQMDHVVRSGSTGKDEMCNFYIMFYTDSSVQDPSGTCPGNILHSITGKNFPPDVSIPLPPNRALEEEATGHHHHHHGAMGGGRGGGDVEAEPEAKVTEKTTVKMERTSMTTTLPAATEDMSESLKQQRLLEALGAGMDGNANRRQWLYDWKEGNADGGGKKHSLDRGTVGDVDNVLGSQYPQDARYDLGGKNQHLYDGQDMDGIRARDLSHQNRANSKYPFSYANNDYDKSDTESLSRNRNKEFEAMNEQLQRFPHKNEMPKQQGLPAYQQGDGQEPSRQLPQQRYQQPPNSRLQPLPQQRYQQQPTSRLQQQKQSGGLLMPHGTPKANKSHSHVHIAKHLVFNSTWHPQGQTHGQVGGVATDSDGNVYVFHRGSRIWNAQSFDYDNNFMYPDAPIAENVILVVTESGQFVKAFGTGDYFMPHGITVDKDKNIWLTDVALHQVFKISPGQTKPSLTLGKRFKHGTDFSHFCKPTDVAVMSTGEFFVSDGYCNTRIMKFSKTGEFIKAWGKANYNFRQAQPAPGTFFIPHSVAVSEKDHIVFVADRENGRIQTFDLEGNLLSIIQHKEFGPRLFAVDFCPEYGGILFAVNGPSLDGSLDTVVQGFTLDVHNGDILEQWNLPQHLKNPHDVCAHPSSHSVYVGELDPRALWKFVRLGAAKAKEVIGHYGEHHHDDDGQEHSNNEKIDSVKKQLAPKPSAAPSDKPTPANDGDKASGDSGTIAANNKTANGNHLDMSKKPVESGDMMPSIIIGALLVIPVVLLLTITLIVRARQNGKLQCLGGRQAKRNRVFNFQKFLGNSHKGFDPLSTEESDHDIDPEDSDHDEYTAPRKNKP